MTPNSLSFAKNVPYTFLQVKSKQLGISLVQIIWHLPRLGTMLRFRMICVRVFIGPGWVAHIATGGWKPDSEKSHLYCWGGGKIQTLSVTFTLRTSLKDVWGHSNRTSGTFQQDVLQCFIFGFSPDICAPYAYIWTVNRCPTVVTV